MIYESKSIREGIHEDILDHECFFDEKAFAEYFDIDGRKLLGIMTSGRRTRNELTGREEVMLLLRCHDVRDVRENSVVRVNQRAYYVSEAVRVQDAYWKLKLQVNE